MSVMQYVVAPALPLPLPPFSFGKAAFAQAQAQAQAQEEAATTYCPDGMLRLVSNANANAKRAKEKENEHEHENENENENEKQRRAERKRRRTTQVTSDLIQAARCANANANGYEAAMPLALARLNDARTRNWSPQLAQSQPQSQPQPQSRNSTLLPLPMPIASPRATDNIVLLNGGCLQMQISSTLPAALCADKQEMRTRTRTRGCAPTPTPTQKEATRQQAQAHAHAHLASVQPQSRCSSSSASRAANYQRSGTGHTPYGAATAPHSKRERERDAHAHANENVNVNANGRHQQVTKDAIYSLARSGSENEKENSKLLCSFSCAHSDEEVRRSNTSLSSTCARQPSLLDSLHRRYYRSQKHENENEKEKENDAIADWRSDSSLNVRNEARLSVISDSTCSTVTADTTDSEHTERVSRASSDSQLTLCLLPEQGAMRTDERVLHPDAAALLRPHDDHVHVHRDAHSHAQDADADADAGRKSLPVTKQRDVFEQQFVSQLSEPSHIERRMKNKPHLLKTINSKHSSQRNSSASSNSNGRPSTADLSKAARRKSHDDCETGFIRNITNRLKAARNLIRNGDLTSRTTRSQSVTSENQHAVGASKRRQHSLEASAGFKPDCQIGMPAVQLSPGMQEKLKALKCVKLHAAPSTSHGNLESISKTASAKMAHEPDSLLKHSCDTLAHLDNGKVKQPQPQPQPPQLVPVKSSPKQASRVDVDTHLAVSAKAEQKERQFDSLEKQRALECAERKQTWPESGDAQEALSDGDENENKQTQAQAQAQAQTQAIRTESNEVLKQQLDSVLRSLMAEIDSFACSDSSAKKAQVRADEELLGAPTPTCTPTHATQRSPCADATKKEYQRHSPPSHKGLGQSKSARLVLAPKSVHGSERPSGNTGSPNAANAQSDKSPGAANSNSGGGSNSKDNSRAEARGEPAGEASGGQAAPGGLPSQLVDTASLLPISRLTVSQLHSFRKMAFVNLASLLEVACPNFKFRNDHWSLFRLRRKKDTAGLSASTDSAIAALSPPPKLSSTSLKNACHSMFGVPLEILQMRLQQSLPVCVLEAMRFLERETREKDPAAQSSTSPINEGSVCCSDVVGIFRKSGNRKNVEELRRLMEMEVESDKPKASIFDVLNITTFTVYDVADCLKQFFRELPECLLTQKISEVLIAVYESVPEESRFDLLRYVVLLLPDANREVLMTLLYFLKSLSISCKRHQMNASNLAVCFAPSLFYFPNSVMSTSGGPVPGASAASSNASTRRARRATGIPDMKELQKQKAAQLCLTDFISHCERLFAVDLRSLLPPRSVSNVFTPASAERSAQPSENAQENAQAAADAADVTPCTRQRCNTGASDRQESEEKENDKDDAYSVASLTEQRNRVASCSNAQNAAAGHSHVLCRSMTEPFAKSYATLIDSHLSTIVKEYRTEKQRKKRGWITVNLLPGIIRQTGQLAADENSPALAYKKVDCECAEENELNLWRGTMIIDESVDALYSILVNESDWNGSVSEWQTVTQLDQSSDVVKFRKNDAFCGGRPDDNGQLLTTKNYCVVRYSMRSKPQAKQGSNSSLSLVNIKKDVAVYLCTSVHESLLYDSASTAYNENQVAWVFERCFVLEPLGTTNLPHPRTLVTLFWREDVRGKTADWYMRFWPQQCYLELLRFKQYLHKHNAKSGR